MGKFKLLLSGVLLGGAMLAGWAGLVQGQGEGGQNVRVEQNWTGRLIGKDKEPLRSAAPAKQYVSGPKTFAAIWKEWRTEEKIPAIDFSKKLVLVCTAGGPNAVKLTPHLENGNLTVKASATLVGGPGFGYVFGVIDRAGIKTVQGKPIAKDD